ncbi:MAG: hypothetical protein M0Z78_08770 [Betaproteobacteria bacterium]|nr:hypothetical protein [Betaproteobacteria bacterium]
MKLVVLATIITMTVIAAISGGWRVDEYTSIRELARSEAVSGMDEVGSGDCRVVNTIAALRTPGSYIVYGTIRDAHGENRHLWAMDSRGRIIDKSCPSEMTECRDRGYRAIVRTSDMKVIWTAPGDQSWRDSHAYTTAFVAAIKSRGASL